MLFLLSVYQVFMKCSPLANGELVAAYKDHCDFSRTGHHNLKPALMPKPNFVKYNLCLGFQVNLLHYFRQSQLGIITIA